MGIFTKRWQAVPNDQVNSETGSESPVGQAWQADMVNAEYCENRNNGHPIPVGTVATPFYGTNVARNNGADIEPIPITPVRGQNWPEMQIQLRNGWETTCYGKKLSYDDYLRMLTDSATRGRNYLIPQPSSAGRAGYVQGPAPANVTQYVQNTSGSQPNAPGGPGFIAQNVDLSGRRFYG